jgi:hypothetical protein
VVLKGCGSRGFCHASAVFLFTQCEEIVRCPNGTTSAVGATSIYDCVLSSSSTIDDVLLRVSPFPANHSLLRQVQPSDARRELVNDTNTLATAPRYPARALPFLQPYITLRGWDVATITIDLRALSLNITYYADWRFGVYENCQPCPARYRCDYADSANPTCGISLGDQETYGVYCADCCKCRKFVMPAYFEKYSSKTSNVLPNNVEIFPYLDNKHKMLQLTITALQDVTVVFTLELMHGLFVADFTTNFLNTADVR